MHASPLTTIEADLAAVDVAVVADLFPLVDPVPLRLVVEGDPLRLVDVVDLVVHRPRIRPNSRPIPSRGVVMMRNLRTRTKVLRLRLRRLLPRLRAPGQLGSQLLPRVDPRRLVDPLPLALPADNRLLRPASLTLNLHDSIELGFLPSSAHNILAYSLFTCLGFIRAFCDLFFTPLFPPPILFLFYMVVAVCACV